jgi:carboxyl-terminal processing protease
MASTPDLVARVWSIVYANYYLPDFGGVDWIEVAKKTADQIRPDMTESDMDQVIKGMLSVLNDKHTFYLSPEEVAKRDAEGYEGVGFATNEHPTEPGLNVVIRVLPESPALHAGIQPGWLFLGEQSGKYRFLDDFQQLHEYALEETFIQNTYLDRSSKFISSDTLVIRFDRFDEGSAAWIENEVATIDESTRVILDLRWNPGGRVVELEKLAGLLFPRMTLLGIIESKTNRQERMYARKRKSGGYFKGDLVILLSEFSGSSSEILARAVQYHHRGWIVGESKSAGQVLISPSWKLSNGGLLYVSARDFRGPDGKRLQDVGVTPDYLVESQSFFNLRKRHDPVLEKALEVLK